MTNEPTRATLSVDESAALLGVSRWAVYDSVNRGEIQAIRVGRRIRIARQPLLQILGLASNISAEPDAEVTRHPRESGNERRRSGRPANE